MSGGAVATQDRIRAERVLTVPNLLSALRLAGVPLFLWLLLGPHADVAALLVLMASGVTDYLDGWIARRYDQGSRLGQLLDPVADRLYIAATLVAFLVRDIIPVWLFVVLVGRDLLLTAMLPLLRRRGYGPPAVNLVGKAATLCLLYAFPLLLLGQFSGTTGDVCKPVAWAFALWGTALYVFAGVLYFLQGLRVLSVPVGPAEGAA